MGLGAPSISDDLWQDRLHHSIVRHALEPPDISASDKSISRPYKNGCIHFGITHGAGDGLSKALLHRRA